MKAIAEDILKFGGGGASRFGLRFDRVAIRVLGELRAFTEASAPEDIAVIITISAPIRRPAETVDDLKREIGVALSGDIPSRDQCRACQGNDVRIRFVAESANRSARFVGFVHNRHAPPGPLLDLAEQWLRRQPG